MYDCLFMSLGDSNDENANSLTIVIYIFHLIKHYVTEMKKVTLDNIY